MSPAMPPQHSRASRLGARLSSQSEAELEAHMDGTLTAISVEANLPGALPVALQLIDTMRRGPGRLVLVTEGLTTEFVSDAFECANAIDEARGLMTSKTTPPERTTHVHVGTRSSEGAIRVVPEGYGGHVLTDSAIAVNPTRDPNALGIMFTAALGAAEAFKTIAKVRPERVYTAAHLAFCPVSLCDDLGVAPDLPDGFEVDLGLIGLGAIGTAIAKILGGLPLSGRILLVDRQGFALENLGTYSLGTRADADAAVRKVHLASRALGRYQTAVFDRPVAELPAAIGAGEQQWPSTILAGLDDVEPRHEVQRVWPDELIDAATGDTVCGIHYVMEAQPCMMCFFPTRRSGPSAEERLAAATGLDPQVLGTDEVLSEADLVGVDDKHLPRLRDLLGTPKCALASEFGLSELDSSDFRPSIPFVSQQAACLAVGRYIASAAGADTTRNMVQYDTLIGPSFAAAEIRDANPNCYCQQRADIIEAVRQAFRADRGASDVEK